MRQCGQTTVQMRTALHGSLFIWCNENLLYPRQLANLLNRRDLQIVGPSFLTSGETRGRRWPAFVVDHAAKLTGEQLDAYEALLARSTDNDQSNSPAAEC